MDPSSGGAGAGAWGRSFGCGRWRRGWGFGEPAEKRQGRTPRRAGPLAGWGCPAWVATFSGRRDAATRRDGVSPSEGSTRSGTPPPAPPARDAAVADAPPAQTAEPPRAAAPRLPAAAPARVARAAKAPPAARQSQRRRRQPLSRQPPADPQSHSCLSLRPAEFSPSFRESRPATQSGSSRATPAKPSRRRSRATPRCPPAGRRPNPRDCGSR